MKRFLLSICILLTTWSIQAQTFTVEPLVFSDTVRVTVSGLQNDTITIQAFDPAGREVLFPVRDSVVQNTLTLTLQTHTLTPWVYLFSCRIHGKETLGIRAEKQAYTSVVTPTLPTSSEISVYPNPCQEFLQVRFPSHLQDAAYQMFDLAGRPVNQGSLQSILPTDQLPEGLYFLHVYNAGKTAWVLPFIKD